MASVATSYLGAVYNVNRFAKTMTAMCALLRKHKFEAIAFTGTSGAAFAYPLSIRLKKPLICVRKEGSHYGSKVEGVYGIKNYVIVDDFISSGDTVDKIINEVEDMARKNRVAKPKCVGIFLYSEWAEGRESYADIPIKTLGRKIR